MFCAKCGTTIEAGTTCSQCVLTVAPHADELPAGVKGFSWGALLLNWIWAIGNRTWIGLLALVPVIGFPMMIVLGFKGREWAWRNGHWESVEEFDRVQKKWSRWGVILTLALFAAWFAAVAFVGTASLEG